MKCVNKEDFISIWKANKAVEARDLGQKVKII